VRCHRRAVELLGGLPIESNAAYRADLGAAWVNLGCALQAAGDESGLAEALGAFDRAVGLLERLPIGGNPRFRHNLAAARMGRADTLAGIDTEASRAEALRDYDLAIEIARGLPMDEKPSFRILLAGCGINRGNLLQRMDGAPALAEAVRSYDRALEALGTLPQSGHRMARHHAATAWTNRAEALLRFAPHVNAGQAVDSARRALAQIEGRDQAGPAAAGLQLRALRLKARGLALLLQSSGPAPRADGVAALTDLAERGIALATGCRGRAPGEFDPHMVWFFAFGSRIYGRYQPQFLAEFVEEVLRRWNSRGGPAVETQLRAVARQAVTRTLEGLCRHQPIVGGTRRAELLLDAVRDLRGAAHRLQS
jgi:hypothetical protein